MINPDTIERIRGANPVPEADLLHREPDEAAGLFSSIVRRRDTMLGTKLQRPSPPLSQRRPWYRRPAPVFIVAVIIALAVIVPVALLGGSGADVADEPSAPEATTVAPVTTVEAPATTTAPTTVALRTSVAEPSVPEADYDWAQIELDVGVFPGSATIRGITHNGSMFVAVGRGVDDCAKVWLSPDGKDWEYANLVGPDTARCSAELSDVAMAGTVAVAIGSGRDGPMLWTSENAGSDWFEVPSGSWPGAEVGADGPGVGRSGEVLADWATAIAASDTGFVVASGHEDCSEPECVHISALWFSPDGQQWEAAIAPVTDGIFDLAAGPDGFVAVAGWDHLTRSGAATVLISPDGTTWSLVTALEGTGSDGAACFVGPNAVTHGPAGYVIAGDCVPDGAEMAYSSAWRSDDGVTWTQVPYDAAAFGDPAYITSIAANEHGYVAAGWTLSPTDFPATVWFSEDGLSWTRTEVGEGNSGVSDVAVHDGTAVAVGDDGGEPAVWVGSRP